jgi:DNA-binding NarL/FixJ family response regulator
VIAEAEDAPGAVDAALREQPDLALLDANMPGSGLAAAWEISSRLPSTRVVMLTVSRDDSHLFAALRPGAAGYLLTSREWEVLELMRRRMTTAQIARTLVVSPATVRSHVAATLRKLRVPDRDAAVRVVEPAEPD